MPHPGNQPEPAVLLIGHGSRDERAQREFLRVAEHVSKLVPRFRTAHAFLEIADPTIPAAIDTLAAEGHRNLVVVPVFLFSARHVPEDIPRLVSLAAARHGMDVSFARHLADHPRLLEHSAASVRQAVRCAPWSDPGGPPDTVVLVGRGSTVGAARQETDGYANGLHQSLGCRCIETCYVELCDPRLEHTLERMSVLRRRRVAVIPHLLFAGQLVDRVQQVFAGFADASKDLDWVLCGHIGADASLAEALCERLLECVPARAP